MLKGKTKKGLQNTRDELKETESQIARDNATVPIEGNFIFSSEKILSKTIVFDISKIKAEKAIDKIIENLPANNEELGIVLKLGSNYFFKKT